MDILFTLYLPLAFISIPVSFSWRRHHPDQFTFHHVSSWQTQTHLYKYTHNKMLNPALPGACLFNGISKDGEQWERCHASYILTGVRSLARHLVRLRSQCWLSPLPASTMKENQGVTIPLEKFLMFCSLFKSGLARVPRRAWHISGTYWELVCNVCQKKKGTTSWWSSS